ncbi:MAG TPA: ATP-binding protein [Franconibacter pulveris]|nr:ATP-binding protein [Franconibacter pulveris]
MNGSVTFPAALSSLPDIAQWLAQHMAPLPVDDAWRYALDLAVCEAAANIIRHALNEQSDCAFTATFERQPDEVRVHFTDGGAPMPEGAIQKAWNKIGSDSEMDLESGRGVMLILLSVDEFNIARQDGENHTTLIKRTDY